MTFDKQRARDACAIAGQERPWLVRVDSSGFVDVVDANGMFVAEFGCGSPDEARLTAEATDILPSALARIDELERALGEACEIASDATAPEYEDVHARLAALRAIGGGK